MNSCDVTHWLERIDRSTGAAALASIGLELVDYLNRLPETERDEVRRLMQEQLSTRFEALDNKLTKLENRYGHPVDV